MKLADRHLVEGTEPHIYIGRRMFPDRKTGQPVSSNRWCAEYRVNGRQRREPLGTSNKQMAIQRAWEVHRRLTAGETAPLKKRTTIKEIVDGYLDFQRLRGRAPKTIEKYELVGRNVIEWSGDDGSRRASTLTEDDLYRFRQGLGERGLTEKTIHDRSVVFKQMLRWAATKRLIPIDPFAGMPLTKPEPTPQPVLTPQQVGVLLEKANIHIRPVIATLAWTGLRFGELAELQWSNVETNGNGQSFFIITKGGSTPGKTKGRRSRRIPIHSELMKILEALPRHADRIFTALPTEKYPALDRPLNERRVLASFKQLCRKCGFQNWKGLKLHTLRHVFASMCARNHVPERYALAFMGQKSSAVLDLYVHMYDDAAHEAAETIVYPLSPSKSVEEEIVASADRKKEFR